MAGPAIWIRTLSTVGSVLTALVLLVGLILTAIAYFQKGRSRVALLGALGFLLMFLLSCCSLTWNVAERPILTELRGPSMSNYFTIKSVILFLLGLGNLLGLGLIVAALWTGGKKE